MDGWMLKMPAALLCAHTQSVVVLAHFVGLSQSIFILFIIIFRVTLTTNTDFVLLLPAG